MLVRFANNVAKRSDPKFQDRKDKIHNVTLAVIEGIKHLWNGMFAFHMSQQEHLYTLTADQVRNYKAEKDASAKALAKSHGSSRHIGRNTVTMMTYPLPSVSTNQMYYLGQDCSFLVVFPCLSLNYS